MDTIASSNLNVMIAAAQNAARFLLRDFGEMENLQSSSDQGLRFATNGRIKVEKVILEELKIARPKFGIMTPGETINGSDISHRFVVNPISGFENFARALPFFAISIALMEQREVIAAVVYAPMLDKLFLAEKGGGAFVIETRMRRRIRVSKSHTPAQVYGQDMDFSCPALAGGYIASGSIDAGIFSMTSVFDIAAPAFMVKEAGGHVDGLDAEGVGGKDIFGAHRVILANNSLQPSPAESIISKK